MAYNNDYAYKKKDMRSATMPQEHFEKKYAQEGYGNGYGNGKSNGYSKNTRSDKYPRYASEFNAPEELHKRTQKLNTFVKEKGKKHYG